MHNPGLDLIYITKYNATAKCHNWAQRLRLDVGEMLLRQWTLFLSTEDISKRCYPFSNEWKWIFFPINMLILIADVEQFGFMSVSRAIVRYYHLVVLKGATKDGNCSLPSEEEPVLFRFWGCYRGWFQYFHSNCLIIILYCSCFFSSNYIL